MKYKINTDVFGGGRIIQELSSVDDNNQVTRLSRWIVNTREAAVHQALLKLGWTPPNTHMHVDTALCDECAKIGRNGEHSWYCRKCRKELHQ